MNTLQLRSTRAFAAVGVAAAMTVAGATIPATALAADRGLYGSQDPTYDGVYRQSLAILGLVANDAAAGRSSKRWLLNQQCAKGAFQAYRANTAKPCGKSDPSTYTGPDSNSTAMAAMALRAQGSRPQAKDAVRALLRFRNSDGGFGYYIGNSSDANSTGLAMSALRPWGAQRYTDALSGGRSWLRKAQLRCTGRAAQRGLLSYQRSPKTANYLASAQGTLGLVTSLPAQTNTAAKSGSPLKCRDGAVVGKYNTSRAALDALARVMNKNRGMLPNDVGAGPNITGTALGVIALRSAKMRASTVNTAVKRLKTRAKKYTQATTTPNAGALGTLLLTASTTGQNPARFGGVNLTRTLQSTRQG